jgi:hypothetical protein
MDKRNLELAFLGGAGLLAIAGVVYVVHQGLSSLSAPRDSWPPKNERDEGEQVALYKQKLRTPDNPFSPRSPEDTAVFLSRVIDHEVKKGELPSGREYATQAIQHQLDGRVESLAARPESRALIARVRDGTKKRDALTRLLALYERRPREAAGKEAVRKFDQELEGLSAQFCGIPFDAAACPELAEEIGKLYQGRLGAAKQDARLKQVVQDIETNCLARQR